MTETEARSTTSVAPALRELLSEAVDYAGMFPPAALHLDEALDRYLAYRGSEASWMLARFIIRTGRLRELDSRSESFATGPIFRAALLPSSGAGAEGQLAALESDLEEVQRFLKLHGGRVAIDQIELRLPEELVDTDVVTVRHFLDRLHKSLAKYGLQEIDRFIEIPLDDFLHQTLPVVSGAMAAFNRDAPPSDVGRACLKMRTGGTEADAFPAVEHVANVVVTCIRAGVPFKATAGLHHPFRRYDESLRTHMHGFLSFFAGAVLAAARELDDEQVAEILEDAKPDHFTFGAEGLAWKHLRASIQAIKRVRRSGALSFGSCSFTEPVEDLKALGLLHH